MRQIMAIYYSKLIIIMSCSLSFTECFGRYARSVCHSAVVRVRFLQNKIMACVPTIQLIDTDRNWPAGTGSRPSFGLHNLRLFSSCYLFTFQPVSFGIFTSCLFGSSSCGGRFFFICSLWSRLHPSIFCWFQLLLLLFFFPDLVLLLRLAAALLVSSNIPPGCLAGGS